MKKVLILLTALVGLNTISTAQNAPAPRGNRGEVREQRAKKGGDQLGLNEDQKKQLADLRAAEKGRIQAVKSDAGLSKEQKMEKIKSIRAEQKEKVRSILTPEQYAKMEAKRAEMQEKRGKKGKKGQKGQRGKKGRAPQNDDDMDEDDDM